jgi:hypothetical protein
MKVWRLKYALKVLGFKVLIHYCENKDPRINGLIVFSIHPNNL